MWVYISTKAVRYPLKKACYNNRPGYLINAPHKAATYYAREVLDMRSYTFPLSPLTVIVPVICLCLAGGSAIADPPLEDWCCEYQVGDVDMSGAIDITDLSVLIDNMFLTFTPLQCWGEADVNLDYNVDIADLQAFLDYSQFCDGFGPGGSCRTRRSSWPT